MKKLFSLCVIASLPMLAISTAFAADQDSGVCNKIAIVDDQKVFEDSVAAKSIQQQREKKNNEYQAEINKKEGELNKKSQELSKQQSVLSKEAFDDKVQEFNNKVMEVQREVQMKRAELDQSSMDAFGEIQKVVVEIIQQMAAEKGFCIALSAGQTHYFAPQLDISAEVIKKLNDKLKKVDIKFPSAASKKPADKK